jgi:hypothetical protein
MNHIKMGEPTLKETHPMSEVKDLKEQISRIRENTKITQIMVSRCVKMPRGGGDVFVSLTGNYGEPNDVEGGLKRTSWLSNKLAHRVSYRGNNVRVPFATQRTILVSSL